MTPKQEKFCHVYIETSNATEAYRQAYNCENMKPESINRTAKKMMDNVKIASRIAELQSEHKERHNVTVDSIIDELQESRKMAIELQNPSAATQATMGKAKVTGLLEDKIHITGTKLRIIDLEGRYERG